MILDSFSNIERYARVLPFFETAVDLLCSGTIDRLPEGLSVFQEHPVTVSCMKRAGISESAAKMEAHRRFIDVQCLFDGVERIGWRPIDDCREIDVPYDEEKDIMFFRDRPTTFCTLRPGMFAVFFPEDVHAPLIGEVMIRKAVLKLPI